MKKILLSAGAIMLCTIGFAQVSSSTTSGATPDARTVIALPGAATTANTGESIQNGNGNKVRVRQAGTNQSVYTEQSDGSGTGGNLGIIMQTGSVESDSGALNAAELIQLGTANQATLLQGGDRNDAIVLQGTDDDGTQNNLARIAQGPGEQSEDNYAAIKQDGLGNNQANIAQSRDNNDAYTIQDGDANKSNVFQDGGNIENGDGHQALTEQYGDRNQSTINQDSNGNNVGASAIAHTIQEGDDNFAVQSQNAKTNSGSVGVSGIINQGNLTSFDEIGESLNNPLNNGTNLYDSVSAIDNVENNGQNAGSQGGIAFQTQNARMSAAEIHQFGSSSQDSNYAEQNQSGWNQNALIVQNSFGNSNGGGNYAKQVQLTDNNDAAIVQLGRDNKSHQYQQDRRNEVLSTQRGEGNLLNTHQFGNNNVAHTAQRGSNNAALVVQRGGHSYNTTQNVPGGNPDGGNQIDVLQLGPNGDFGADGVHCSFMEELPTNMIPSIPVISIEDICPDC